MNVYAVGSRSLLGGVREFVADAETIVIRQGLRTARARGLILSYLIQPVLYLALFTQVFGGLQELPDFRATGFDSYLNFFLPGVLAMGAVGAGLTSGLGVVADLGSGVFDRLLVAPIHRSTIFVGRLVADAFRTALQALILVSLAMGLGFRSERPAALLILVEGAALVGIGASTLSMLVGIATRSFEATNLVANLLAFPLILMSTAMVPYDLLPSWLQLVSRFNPLTLTIELGRSAMLGQVSGVQFALSHLSFVLPSAGCLAAANWLLRNRYLS